MNEANQDTHKAEVFDKRAWLVLVSVVPQNMICEICWEFGGKIVVFVAN
jgi:hypothetical protein